jgi:hypothetical protein
MGVNDEEQCNEGGAAGDADDNERQGDGSKLFGVGTEAGLTRRGGRGGWRRRADGQGTRPSPTSGTASVMIPQGHALNVRNLVAVLTMEDASMVTTVIMAPVLRPAAMPAMATPLGTTTLPPPEPLSPAKRMMRDRRTMTAAVMTGTTTRTTTSGGGVRSSTCPPPCHHCLSATSSAMPLPWPSRCCRALRCPGSVSDTVTP